MPKQHSTRSLTEGAMLAAITVLLSLLGAYFLPYLFFITPVPLIILVYRHGMRAGILVALTAALLGGVVISMITTMIFLLILGLVGIALGEALREGFSPPRIMLVGTVTSVVALLLLFAVATLLFDVNLIETTFSALEKSLRQVTELYGKMGVDEEKLLGTFSVEELLRVLRLTLPVALLSSAIFITFINYWLARLILLRLGVRLPWFRPFQQWRFPWYLAWGYILGRGLLLLTPQTRPSTLLAIGLNLEIFFNYVFLLQGLAIIWFFFDKHNVPKLVRWLAVFFALNPLFSTLIVWGGVLDTWFNFRKLDSENTA